MWALGFSGTVAESKHHVVESVLKTDYCNLVYQLFLFEQLRTANRSESMGMIELQIMEEFFSKNYLSRDFYFWTS